jgi:ABC-2 type transport system permease protein
MMIRILDIAGKDLLQLVRERQTFLFLLVMPIAFTFLFGYAFGGFSSDGSDPRLPVGFQDEDNSSLSRQLHELLDASEVIRLEEYGRLAHTALQARVADEDLAAAIIIPDRYGHSLLDGKPARLILIGDTGSPAGRSVESEVLSAVIRLDGAVRTALIMEREAGDQAPFDYALEKALSSWEEPPIRVSETTSSAIQSQDDGNEALAHTSPGMMLQFAIAGLLNSAQILVSERKTRALQRMLTTATTRSQILVGHFLAIFALVFCQFLVLLGFGQLVLGVGYLSAPLATLLMAFTAALCIAALGLLIGTMARTDEQAIIFSLIPMFVLAGLGGAWVPLEVTGPIFQIIGHASPVAWAMDGFKNISVRGLGIESVVLPAAALCSYALLFFVLATWRFHAIQEH